MQAPRSLDLLRRKTRPLLLPLVLGASLISLTVGCEGDAADSLRRGARGASNDDGGPGADGAEDPAVTDLEGKVPAGPAMMRNLSNREYLNAISDLIGERLSPDLQATWTATTHFSGFDAVSWSNLDTKAIRDRSDALEKILDRAVASPKVMSCSVSSADGLGYAGCAKTIVEPFATRAYGRPVTAAEAAALAERYDETIALAKTVRTAPADIFKEGVRAAIGTVLLAPQFITRTEAAPTVDFVGERDLTANELASRISFMILGSLPDDELWGAAQDGSLVSTEVLVGQVQRLIDTKTDVFVQSFMGQWFDFRAYEDAEPGSIEQAMWTESWRTLVDVFKEDLPATAMIKPGFTYLNQELAAHYGIAGQFSAQFERVPTDERGGVLQQGSWLSLSATALKTSPIHRGRLVQDRFLCKIVPAPDSDLFEKIQEVSESIPATATVKERVETHRNAGPACKGCHEYMDPIGIGLEGFDQFGKVRTTYADTKQPVETDSHILGKPFKTFSELNEILAGLPDYSRCAAEKLTIFTVRRIVESGQAGDAALLDYLTYASNGKPPSVREMVLRMVKSKAFRKVIHGAKG